jgi:hypothetical protein
MELIKQRLKNIRFLAGLAILVILISCKRESSNGKLECILESIDIEKKGMILAIGQHNGWTDSTVLLLITYHNKSEEKLIGSNLKGAYKGSNIYFNQGNLDTLDKKIYNQISNNIKWHNYVSEEMDEDYIPPPYDPINIQIEYDLEKECVFKIIRGKGYIDLKTLSKCKCNS